MRRLSMKNKRKRSEAASGSDSEENGVGGTNANSSDEMDKGKENQEIDSPKKGGSKKRLSRGRHSQKGTMKESIGGGKKDREDTQASGDAEDEENGNVGKGAVGKRRKKEDQKASTSETPNNEKEYEVEKIIGQRTIKGRRQFLVRWKGYNEDADTWEHEKDLNCLMLIEKFLMEESENDDSTDAKKPKKTEKSEKLSKTVKATTPKTEKKTRGSNITPKKSMENNEDGKNIGNNKDEQKEFEVEKILEVHFKKNKTREFLIRWKGFSSADDTWEPEENLNCPDLISRFMKKVEKARNSDIRELRTNPTHTKRYTLTTHEPGRRLSRRNIDKQRTTYHECDE